MRYLSLLLLFFAFGQTVKADWHEPYIGSRVFWDSSTRKVVMNASGYGRIIQLQDGRLMACATGIMSGGGIDICFSNDMGSSWSSATRIVTNSNNILNCVSDFVQLADGTIIVAYNPRPQEPYTVDRKFGIRCKVSQDNGNTWSNEVFVNDAQHLFIDGCWEPALLELPSGEVHLYFADEGPYTSSGEQQISLCRSFDKGFSWTAPQKVSFRAGYRDGMPVPLLLQNQQEIVVVIEDNGWPGVKSFFPTTVRCPLEKNWGDGYFIPANSPAREKTLDPAFAPQDILGGAPYIRQLPWGETLVSFQSTYDHGANNTMYAAVGDAEARNFKALSQPFISSLSDELLWNSLAVVDTGIVVAVSGVNANVEMVKGYPTRSLQAPYARPTIDGKITKNEGYYRSVASQVIIGTQIRSRASADFCYDSDSLYFISRVSDNTQVDNDCVRLLLDIAGCSDTKPQEGTYYIAFRRDGKVSVNVGKNGYWRSGPESNSRVAIGKTASAYVIEAAIPWSDLGCMEPPCGKRMAASVEVVDYRSNLKYTDCIPDAQTDVPWTWMEFRLHNMPDGIKGITAKPAKPEVKVFFNGNRLTINCGESIARAEVVAIDGRMLGCLLCTGWQASGEISYKGMAILRLSLRNGKTITKNIVL